jgi:hypothetical protein
MVGLRLSGVSMATTLPKFSLLYFSEPSTSIWSSFDRRDRAVLERDDRAVALHRVLGRAKISEPSLSLMT